VQFTTCALFRFLLAALLGSLLVREFRDELRYVPVVELSLTEASTRRRKRQNERGGEESASKLMELCVCACVRACVKETR
jgi:hypothetical protein